MFANVYISNYCYFCANPTITVYYNFIIWLLYYALIFYRYIRIFVFMIMICNKNEWCYIYIGFYDNLIST